jgi:hypothetical protein
MCSFTEGNNLLHILHRACAYLLRKLSKLFQYVYVLLLAAPVLLIKRSISLPFKVVSGHGAVMIRDPLS